MAKKLDLIKEAIKVRMGGESHNVEIPYHIAHARQVKKRGEEWHQTLTDHGLVHNPMHDARIRTHSNDFPMNIKYKHESDRHGYPETHGEVQVWDHTGHSLLGSRYVTHGSASSLKKAFKELGVPKI